MQNPWIIGIGTGITTALAIGLVRLIVLGVRAALGPFSGQYIALTLIEGTDTVLVEDVRCRHHGNAVSGRIYGVAFADDHGHADSSYEFTRNAAEYRFSGFVDERLIVVSYRTTIPGLHSSGALTLSGDSEGRVFSGSWAGLGTERVGSATCLWIRLGRRVDSRRNRHEFLDHAAAELVALRRSRRDGKDHLRSLRRVLQKTVLLTRDSSGVDYDFRASVELPGDEA